MATPTISLTPPTSYIQEPIYLVRTGRGVDTVLRKISSFVYQQIPALCNSKNENHEFPNIPSIIFLHIVESLEKKTKLSISDDNVFELFSAVERLQMDPQKQNCLEYLGNPSAIFENTGDNNNPTTVYEIHPALLQLSPKLKGVKFPIFLEGLNIAILSILNEYAQTKKLSWTSPGLISIPLLLKASRILDLHELAKEAEELFNKEIKRYLKHLKETEKTSLPPKTEYQKFFCHCYAVGKEFAFTQIQEISEKILIDLILRDLKNVAVLAPFFKEYKVFFNKLTVCVLNSQDLKLLETLLENQSSIEDLKLVINSKCDLENEKHLESLTSSLKHVAPSLHSFYFEFDGTIESFGFLIKCVNMHKLVLKVQHLTDAIWPYLPHFQALESVEFVKHKTYDMYKSLSSDMALKHLNECSKIKEIILNGHVSPKESWLDENTNMLPYFFQGKK